ncbi:MAG: PhoH family protein [Candidatus Kariarchaeaceae archaeon]|jgi:phosphate starvation-inducible protein PhoH
MNKNSGPLKRKVNIRSKVKFTDKQEDFIELGMHKQSKMVLCSGPAGTSKTYLSIYCALQLLNMKKHDSIIYIRSAIESADGKLGFLPGEEEVKLAPYLRPLRDKLFDFLTPTDVASVQPHIACEHVGFARGQDWQNKIIIVDEAQNLSKKEIFTLMTRTGEGSKVFILGDPLQSDIGGKSGFGTFFNLFDDMESEKEGIWAFEFDESDIVRSRLVRFVVNKLQTSDVEL